MYIKINTVNPDISYTFPDSNVPELDRNVPDYNDMREEDQNLHPIQVGNVDYGLVISDNLINQKIGAGLSILRTFFISFVLAGGALIFSADVE